MRHLSLVVVSALGLLLAGCASVPVASPELDAEGKRLTPKPGMASIYLCRGGGVGTALVFQTVLDGKVVGALAPDTYQLLSVEPGKHVISASGAENVQQQEVFAAAGQMYFYRLGVNMGWVSGRARLEPIPEAEGRERVLKSKRAQSMLD